MGYRQYAKDYKIEYEEIPGRKRLRAKRVYVGPWYQFTEPPEKIRFLKWFYLIGMALIAVLLLVPMCMDCPFTRIWYIQVPAMAAWIPWVFAACATWRLWTAKDKVDREHRDMLYDRMSGATLFLMGFCLISFLGCVFASSEKSMQTADWVVAVCTVLSGVTGIALFSKRKSLSMEQI